MAHSNSIKVKCPSCRTSNVPILPSALSDATVGRVYAGKCVSCGHFFKFKSELDLPAATSITFTINGEKHTVGDGQQQGGVGVNMSINAYIREVCHLPGSKLMCAEGGCGSCVIHVKRVNPDTKQMVAGCVNSCLMPLYLCDGCDITTVEGVGGSKQGYDNIQKALARSGGSQCGYCSPGMVMSMFGLLTSQTQASQAHSKQQVEDNFDGNICRCTGYRPILDAMKSLVPACPIKDIEELTVCKQRSSSSAAASDNQRKAVHLVLPGNASWLKPVTLTSLYRVLEESQGKAVRIVAGNTAGDGDKVYEVYVDISAVPELYHVQMSAAVLEVGSRVTLSELVGVMTRASTQYPHSYTLRYESQSVPVICGVQMSAAVLEVGSRVTLSELVGVMTRAGTQYPHSYGYLGDIISHMNRVANTPVRNAATWAGNLMLKKSAPQFVSDIFVILETVGATVLVGSASNPAGVPYTCQQLLRLPLTGTELLLSVHIPGLADASHLVRTFKIMSRSQSVLADLSAGYHLSLVTDAAASGQKTVVSAATIVYGGISATFTHATRTEQYLRGKALEDVGVLTGALQLLDKEVIPDESDITRSSAKYRKQLCQATLYKTMIGICSASTPGAISPRFVSAGSTLHRAISSGRQSYPTDPTKYPLTQPLSNITAPLQTSGEAVYISDIRRQSEELFAAFVYTTQANARITRVDVTKALAYPGAVRYVSGEDIPPGGRNSFLPDPGAAGATEPLFTGAEVMCAGQSVGLILAESAEAARQASALVEVTYTEVKPPVLSIDEAIRAQSYFQGVAQEVRKGDARDAINASAHQISGQYECGAQYHFHMETQECVCVPSEGGTLQVYSATQARDLVQAAVAGVCAINKNMVDVVTHRVGGAYGGKAVRSCLPACAAALATTITNRPVRLRMDLKSNMEMIGKRAPYKATYTVGFDSSGVLTGVIVYMYANCGYSAADISLSDATLHVDNTYYCANWHIIPVACKTNLPANTWCRAPGTLPAISIMETIMDHVAKTLQAPAHVIRLRNMYVKGQSNQVGEVLSQCNIRDMWTQLSQSADVASRQTQIDAYNQANRWKKKALYMTPVKYGAVNSRVGFNVQVCVYHGDGSVSVYHGGCNMGQGINTVMSQVCAYELSCDISLVNVYPSRTSYDSNSSASGGSVTTELCVAGVIECCRALRDRMKPVRDKEPDWVRAVNTCYSQGVDLTARKWHYDTRGGSSPQTLYTYFTYGACVCEVTLDVLTGHYILDRCDLLYDCGQSMNPEISIGQVEGAFVMGLGYHLLEKIVYHPQTGRNLTNGTWQYHPPSSKDIPVDFRVTLCKDSVNPVGVLGSRATGEPPLCLAICALFAIKRCIYEALGEVGQDKPYFILNSPATTESIQQHCWLEPLSQFTYK